MFRLFFFMSFTVFLSACGNSAKTNFYMLNTHAQAENFANSDESLRIGVWKVKLPELIDRPEIIARTDLYTIELADFHQWAGGLSNDITQLIAGELSRRLKTDRVVISPWSSYRKNQYQVKIHINRLDGELAGESVLSGAWSLLNAEGNKEITRDAFNYKAHSKEKTYSEMVKIQSQLVVQLAEQISRTILAEK